MKYLIMNCFIVILISGCGVFELDGQLDLYPPSRVTPTAATSLNASLPYPVLSDAYNILIDDGVILYNSITDFDATIAFYETEMTNRNWTQDGYFQLQGNQGVTLTFVDGQGQDAIILIRAQSPNSNQETSFTQITIDHDDGFIDIRNQD